MKQAFIMNILKSRMNMDNFYLEGDLDVQIDVELDFILFIENTNRVCIWLIWYP